MPAKIRLVALALPVAVGLMLLSCGPKEPTRQAGIVEGQTAPQQSIEFSDITVRNSSAIPGHIIPVVVEVIVPGSQKRWPAGLPEKVFRWIPPDFFETIGQRICRPAEHKELHIAQKLRLLFDLHVPVKVHLPPDTPFCESPVVFHLVYEKVVSKNFIPDSYRSLSMLKGHVFQIKRIDGNQ